MKYKIKSCPCCGARAEVYYDENDHAIDCTECSCSVVSWTLSLTDLVADWNRRVRNNKENEIEIEVKNE
jgi:hypothetical protein